MVWKIVRKEPGEITKFLRIHRGMLGDGHGPSQGLGMSQVAYAGRILQAAEEVGFG